MPDASQPPTVSYLLALAALVTPSALAGIFTGEQLAERPWLVIPLLLCGVLVSIALPFGQTVVGDLNARLAPRVTDHLEAFILGVFRKPKQRYFKYLQSKHGTLDLRGTKAQGAVAVELGKVYVPLRLVLRPHHVASSGLVDPRGEPAAITSASDGDDDIADLLDDHDRVAVIGRPGSGKTTLTQHVCLVLASSKSQREAEGWHPYVPIHLTLRKVIALKREGHIPHLEEVIDELIGPHAQNSAHWLKQQLHKGRCLVLLDGYDEVADLASRHALSDWLDGEVLRWEGNKWVVTSRPMGYRECPLKDFTVAEVQPLDMSEVEDFVEDWYLVATRSAHPDDQGAARLKAEEGSEDLLRRLRASEDLNRLAINPFLLTLMASIHLQGGTLPRRRYELYEEIVRVFLGTREAARGLDTGLSEPQKRRLLAGLALFAMTERVRELPTKTAVNALTPLLSRVDPNLAPEAFIRSISARSGLLVEVEQGIWSFSHKSFQEALAAEAMSDSEEEHPWEEMVEDDWWFETICLYAARSDASPIVRACLREYPPTVAGLVLAIRCQDEARELDQDLRQKLREWVDDALEDADPDKRRLAASCRLRNRLMGFHRDSDAVRIDPQLVTNAEYQLFVDEEIEQGRWRAPVHWPEPLFAPGTAEDPVLGVLFTDARAFCDWLTRRRPDLGLFRLPTEDEANRIDDTLVSEQTDQGAYWYRSAGESAGVLWVATITGMERPIQDLQDRVGYDLQLARELFSAESYGVEHGLGKPFTESELQELEDLWNQLCRGDMRVGVNVAVRFIRWCIEPSRLQNLEKGYRYILSPLLRLIALPFRALGWLQKRAKELGNNAIRRWLRKIGKATIKLVGKVLAVTVRLLMRLLGPLIRRTWQAAVVKERARLNSPTAGAAEPTSLVRKWEDAEEGSEADQASFISDVVIMLCFAGFIEALEGETWTPELDGLAIATLHTNPATPEALRTVLQRLSDRHFLTERRQRHAAAKWLCTYARLDLLRTIRHGMTAFCGQALLRGSSKGGSTKSELPDEAIMLVEAWFESFVLEERILGEPGQEGIRLVRQTKPVGNPTTFAPRGAT